jgi:tetratricopeptide (TPR) repeat protein
MSRKGTKRRPPNRSGREQPAAAPAADRRQVAQEAPGLTVGEDDPAARSFGRWDWLFAPALVIAVFLVYWPAWQGGPIWDDDAHITRPALRSWDGLGRIWLDIRATQQYYPLLHSAFWLQHRLWGDATLGYHLVNLALHAAAAILALVVLRRLRVPGAHLAAAIFALHPVQVESVAWITELKNTLSAVFYLGAMLSYLRFDATRGKSWYAWALVLFVLGLLSKTVTATLPAGLLVIFWWQRGRLSWKRDLLPLLPWPVLGAAAGVLTAWVERKLIGAEGEAFALTLVERGLIAGRAIWFYLGQLCWPADLVFIYPRWQVSQGAWWQYLFPLAAAALLAALWMLRRRTRAPLAAVLFFAATLFPVLGFLNVFPFIYSFAADHFQYLASLGIITLASAGAALGLKRAAGWQKLTAQAGCVALVALLAVLSWRQSRMYADVETLYRTTIARNPACWMAHNNLGNALAGRGRADEAIAQYRQALAIKADYAEAQNNLGLALAGRGEVDAAVACYQAALRIKPGYASACYNLGNVLAGRGAIDAAIAYYRKAVRIKPDFALAHNNLGAALAGRGEAGEAIVHYRTALEIEPDYPEAHNNLGAALAGRGAIEAAIAQYRQALAIRPDYAPAHNNLASALACRGELDEAIFHYRRAVEIEPGDAAARRDLDLALAQGAGKRGTAQTRRR